MCLTNTQYFGHRTSHLLFCLLLFIVFMYLSICLEEGGCAQAMAQIVEVGMLESGLSFHHPAVELRPSDLVTRTFTR